MWSCFIPSLQHIVLDVSHPLTFSSLWAAQIRRRRCELCLPYLPDKAGGLQNTALAGFPRSAGEQKHQCWECRQTKHPSDKGWIPRRPRHSREEVYQAAALVLDLLSAADTLVFYTQDRSSEFLLSRVFSLTLSYGTDATQALNPPAAFDCDLTLNWNHTRECNIYRNSGALCFKNTHFLCKRMLMRFYVCTIISAPSSWAASGFPEGHQTETSSRDVEL